MNYNYEQLTTIALFFDRSKLDPQMVCKAHAQGVRLVWGVTFPVDQLGNSTVVNNWIQQQVALVQNTFTDGVNFDVEDQLDENTPGPKQYSALVQATTTALHTAVPGSQVTVDIAWAPGCIDLRCYDYKGLADGSDFLIVMDYDEQSQIFGPCIAGATSPIANLQTGMKGFMALGISAQKLVMGLPWYGHTYECINPVNETVCPLAPHPWRGVQCTDAAAPERGYTDLQVNLLPISTNGRQWDEVAQSPWFNYNEPKTGKRWQMWYDDATSLSVKVTWAKKVGKLRGVSMWNADLVDSKYPKHVADMWAVMNSFFM